MHPGHRNEPDIAMRVPVQQRPVVRRRPLAVHYQHNPVRRRVLYPNAGRYLLHRVRTEAPVLPKHHVLQLRERRLVLPQFERLDSEVRPQVHRRQRLPFPAHLPEILYLPKSRALQQPVRRPVVRRRLYMQIPDAERPGARHRVFQQTTPYPPAPELRQNAARDHRAVYRRFRRQQVVPRYLRADLRQTQVRLRLHPRHRKILPQEFGVRLLLRPDRSAYPVQHRRRRVEVFPPEAAYICLLCHISCPMPRLM